MSPLSSSSNSDSPLSDDSSLSSNSIAKRLIGGGVGLVSLGGLLYLSSTLPQWNEVPLIALTLILGLIILAPQVRSGLIRRRLFLQQWLREEGRLFHWLKGGVLYVSRHFIMSFFWATLILIELQHLHLIEQWIFLGGFGISIGVNVLLFKKFKHILKDAPASVYAREWTMVGLRWSLTLILIPAILYFPRPNLIGLSFQETVFFSLPQDDQIAHGLFGFLQIFSQIKENAFWWFVLNHEQIVQFPPLILSVFHWILMGMYCVYSMSVIYAMSRLMSGLLELTDPYFYHFIRSRSSSSHS